MANVAQLLKRTDSLRSLRSDSESVWRDCFNYTFPLRASGFQSENLTASSAAEKKAQLVDGTGTDAARILASGLMSGLTPANSLWFQLDVANADDTAKKWLEQAGLTLFQNIHSSNYDSAAFECMIDAAVAGWFALYIDEDRELGGFVFEAWPLSQCYCSSTKRGGAVDIVHREFSLTAEQAVAKYDADDLSAEVRKLAAEKPDELVKFQHAIYPRKEYVKGSKLAKNLPIASCHYEVKTKTLVRESGYYELPVVVPRWHIIPDSPYAVGPAFDALPDMKMLNELKRMELAAADIAVAGMWKAVDDGVLNPRTVKVGPRKIIVMGDINSMQPLETGADFNVAFTEEARLQAAIRKVFMADQLQPQDGPQMTATEVHVRVGLIRQLLGPVYGRLQSEFLKRLLDRCFGIAYRAGALGRAPDNIAGQPFHVRYISPLARAQRQEEVMAMDQFENVLMAEAQVNPSGMDVYDWDNAQRERASLLGVPQKLMRSEQDVASLRQARSDAAAKAQAEASQASAVSAGMHSGAEALGARMAS